MTWGPSMALESLTRLRSGTILPVSLRTYSWPDVLGRVAEGLVRLHLDLERYPVEQVEVVHVARAQLGLQGGEDAGFTGTFRASALVRSRSTKIWGTSAE